MYQTDPPIIMKQQKKCLNCLIPEGTTFLDDFFTVANNYQANKANISQVRLNQDGLCNYCSLYRQNYDREIIKAEINEFIHAPQTNPKYSAIVALSGGKDSISALVLAKKYLNLNILAFTYDNGFIPSGVIEQAKRICQDLDVDYLVAKKELYDEFQEEYFLNSSGVWEAKTGVDFCRICSRQIWLHLKQLMLEKNIFRVIYGNKTYTKLEPKVSSLKRFYLEKDGLQEESRNINLLFALQISISEQDQLLQMVGWQDPGLAGYTSNCLIPGFTGYPRSKKINYEAETGYLEMELRSSAYTREEAEKLIEENYYQDKSEEINSFFRRIKNI